MRKIEREASLLVIGPAPALVVRFARRFAKEGYHACLCRRSDLEG